MAGTVPNVQRVEYICGGKVSTPAAGVSRGSSVAKKKSQIVTLSSVSTTDEERTKPE